MEILVAKTAGFCFGVNNAVQRIYDLLQNNNGKIYTLGPIIHNEQMVDCLRKKGVEPINNVNEIDGREESHSNVSIVIRTHGVKPAVYDEINSKKLNIVDVTCPYVKKIHQLVKEKYDEGCRIIIIGDRDHPEVSGINGWCNNTAVIVNSIEDVEKLSESGTKTCVVSQTTITLEKWESLIGCLRKKFNNIIEFNTICQSTINRQVEASDIARVVDLMIVIGSSKSSNTQKLYEICKTYCKKTYKIDSFSELPPLDIKNINKIGITAGASTPDWIIKEVIEKMEELKNKKENDISFQEAFESSIINLKSGDIVKGRIIGYNDAEVYVDLGYKSDGVITLDEFSDDVDFKPEEHLKVGDEIEAFVIKVNDGEGNVQLSKKKVDAIKGWAILEEAYEKKTPVKAKITEETNGGLIASVNGVRVFMPASQIGERYEKDLKKYLKQTIDIRIIELNKNKKKVVGSQRILIQEEKARQENNLWNSIEIGKKYTGVVKSLMNFGAFVDIGGIDGLVHISEISWGKIKHPSEILNVGDNIEVTVLGFDKEKRKISLSCKNPEDNPWNNIDEKFKIGSVVKGKVVKLVPFGAFVELEGGVEGLVHISQICNDRIAKPGDVLNIGQEVDAKVIEVNGEAKKIALSIKEVNPVIEE